MTNPEGLWREAILRPEACIGDAIRNLDAVAIQIALVVDESDTLIGTISDGDIRRGLLRGLNLASPISTVIHHNAIVVPPDVDRELVIQLMTANKVRQIPVVNDERKIIGLHLWDEINLPRTRPNLFVIMAGGLGTRLRPHTESCPKPMLPIAGKPMLEHIIDRAKSSGFSQFVLAIHYLGHMVESYFGDGTKFGVHIQYLREKFPLGTAGALSLMTDGHGYPFIVTNGDVITDIHYGEVLDFHERYGATATMAVRTHEWQHPFGVVHTEGVKIIGFEEKPISRSHINAGIYVLEPIALQFLNGQHCDMPELFERIREAGNHTVAYPMHEPWLDVGRPDDLKQIITKLNLNNVETNNGKN